VSDIEKAAKDAVEAADNTELVRTIAAVLAAQQYGQAQQPAPAPAPVPRPYGAWIALGICGTVAVTGLALAAAVLAVAVAIGAVCATVALLVLRSMFADYQNQKGK
jgi:hypothetical protein